MSKHSKIKLDEDFRDYFLSNVPKVEKCRAFAAADDSFGVITLFIRPLLCLTPCSILLFRHKIYCNIIACILIVFFICYSLMMFFRYIESQNVRAIILDYFKELKVIKPDDEIINIVNNPISHKLLNNPKIIDSLSVIKNEISYEIHIIRQNRPKEIIPKEIIFIKFNNLTERQKQQLESNNKYEFIIINDTPILIKRDCKYLMDFTLKYMSEKDTVNFFKEKILTFKKLMAWVENAVNS